MRKELYSIGRRKKLYIILCILKGLEVRFCVLGLFKRNCSGFGSILRILGSRGKMGASICKLIGLTSLELVIKDSKILILGNNSKSSLMMKLSMMPVGCSESGCILLWSKYSQVKLAFSKSVTLKKLLISSSGTNAYTKS